MKNRITIMMFTPILLVFACLALLPGAQAVVPAPDGGYPGGNTAEGQDALLNLTTGKLNTAVGFLSLRALTTGKLNTATGARALLVNTADGNTAIGAEALSTNTTGPFNTAVGQQALFSNTVGDANTAVGTDALFSNTTGESNTANGTGALLSNTEGDLNTANGKEALANNTTGDNNTASGFGALYNNTAGVQNTAAGASALARNMTGNNNTAVGYQALENTAGGDNIALGFNAGFNVTTANNVICIGALGQNVKSSCYIGQIFGATSSGGTAVFINSDGKLGTMVSSRRFKDEIEPMERASEALFALNPVTFRYKKEIDRQRIPQFGLVAEEVEEVNPDLVVRDKDGKPCSVRYDQVNAMLLNEFLKEHRKVKEQHAAITELRSIVAQQRKDFEVTTAQQQKEIQALTASLKEQAAQIRKVSAQFEVSNPAPQTVANSYQ